MTRKRGVHTLPPMTMSPAQTMQVFGVASPMSVRSVRAGMYGGSELFKAVLLGIALFGVCLVAVAR